MSIERLPPDTILVQTNLAGIVTDIDERPTAPDAKWLVASNNNVNIDVRVSFPTPINTPQIGPDLQEFFVFVRQFDESQSGTPTARIELWEAGALVRAGSNTSVPDGGLLFKLTWNANEITAAADVECKVIGTKVGGAPSARNTVDVGAVEWNVEFLITANPRQWFMPGIDALFRGGMIDEDGTEEYFVPRAGMLNEDQAAAVAGGPKGPLGHPLHGPFGGPI